MPTTKIDRLNRVSTAVRARLAGYDWDEIASAVGYIDSNSAFDAVQRHLSGALKEEAEELATLQYDRYNALLRAVWPQALEGSLPHLDRAVKLIENINRLVGLEHIQVHLRQEVHSTAVLVVTGGEKNYIESLRAARGELETSQQSLPSTT